MLNIRKGRTQGRRPEKEADDDFPDGGRLPEPGEQGPHAMRGKQQNTQRNQQPGQIDVSETQDPSHLASRIRHKHSSARCNFKRS